MWLKQERSVSFVLTFYLCLFLKGYRGSDRPVKTGEPCKSLELLTTWCAAKTLVRNHSFGGFSQAGLLGILAVAEHAGEFDKIIRLSQR